jgi:hypothetical protein
MLFAIKAQRAKTKTILTRNCKLKSWKEKIIWRIKKTTETARQRPKTGKRML